MALRDRINQHILELEPYQPGKPIEELERELGLTDPIKLASNEHPFGPSPKVIAAIHAAVEEIHRYPDGASFVLRDRLATRLDVEPGQLVFGCGGDEVLELLAKTLLSPGDEVLFAWPSFAMYPIVAQGMGARSIRVPLDADQRHDLSAMADAVTDRTKLIFVCNPNNPTGTSVGAKEFDAFMERVPEDVVVMIDECYWEFAERSDFPDSLAWINRRPATLVLRTFSKMYGLAGLRVGYGVAGAELADYLQRARHPFNVNRLAEAAAVAALDDPEHQERTLQVVREGRSYLTRELRDMGIDVTASDANFLLARVGTGVYDQLLRQGVIVRPLTAYGMDDCVRITVGTPEHNERLLKALRRLREEVS